MKYVDCPICKADKTKVFWTGKSNLYKSGDSFTLVQCATCKLVYMNPRPENSDVDHIYSESYIPFKPDRKDFSYNAFYKLLSRIKHISYKKISSNQPVTDEYKKVLDIGCGDGSWLEMQRKAHPKWDFWGQDVSKIACKQVGGRGFRIICKPLQEAELPNNFFDLVYMSHVLEHLPEPISDLKKIKRIIKNNGRIVIHIPNIDSVSAKIFKGYWYGLQLPLHFFHFSPKTASLILEKSGLEVEKIEHYSNPKLFLKSLQILLNKKENSMDPLLWNILRPFGFLEKKLKKSSVITIHAKPKTLKGSA